MQLGYFQVIAEPVSTWVQEIFESRAAAVAALGDEIVDAAAPFGVAGIPVLHGRIFDLGVVERDQFDHRGVQLVLVAHRRGAAFEIAHIGALVGDDQRALELAGVLLVDAEIGRQLHRAAHARRHIDERAVGEHRRVERGEEVVGIGHHRAEILLHQFGMLAQRLRDRHEDHAGLLQFLLEGGRDRHRVEHGIDRDAALPLPFGSPSPSLAGLLRRRRASSARAAGCRASRRSCRISGSTSSSDFGPRLLLRRGVVVDVLIVDLRDSRPAPRSARSWSASGDRPPAATRASIRARSSSPK